MNTSTLQRQNGELQLALAAVVAGHHDAEQAGRERAAGATKRLTLTLALLAAAVMSYDFLLMT